MTGTDNVDRHRFIPRAKSAFVQGSEPRLIWEWQQRRPETFLGHSVTKLRLTLEPTRPATM
jgi:hypothetical protein